MLALEELIPGVSVKGLVPGAAVVIIDVTRHGDAAVEVVYRDPQGNLGSEILYRDDEQRLELAETRAQLEFAADPAMFRMASEAFRIGLAYLFDPYLAVHTSQIEPLPHQIEAVYGDMLSRQPLKFLLADDPGAGKTIMAGMLIRAHGPWRRRACFHLRPATWSSSGRTRCSSSACPSIITRERIETSLTGNPSPRSASPSGDSIRWRAAGTSSRGLTTPTGT